MGNGDEEKVPEAVQALQVELEELQEEAQRDREELEEARLLVEQNNEEMQYLRQQLNDSLSTQRNLVMKVQHLQGQVAGGRAQARTNGSVRVYRTEAGATTLTKLTPEGRRPMKPGGLEAPLGESGVLPPAMPRPTSAAVRRSALSQRARPASAAPSSRSLPAGLDRPTSARSPTCGVEAEDLSSAKGRQGVVTNFYNAASRPSSAWSRDAGPKELDAANFAAPSISANSRPGSAHSGPAPRGATRPASAARTHTGVSASSRPGSAMTYSSTQAPAGTTHLPRDLSPQRAALLIDAAVQAAPTPWTRFYFRENLGKAGMGQEANLKKGNQLFQHFDVMEVDPLVEGEMLSSDKVLTEVTPKWVPESYTRLMYSRHRTGHATPAVKFKSAHSSADVTEHAKLFTDDRKQVMQMAEFVNFVARLLPRSNGDFECLRELQAGLLLHLVHEAGEGKGQLLAQLRAGLRKDFDAQMHAALRELESNAAAEPTLAPKAVHLLKAAFTRAHGGVHRAWSARKTQDDADLNLELSALTAKFMANDVETQMVLATHADQTSLLKTEIAARDDLVADLRAKHAKAAAAADEQAAALKAQVAALQTQLAPAQGQIEALTASQAGLQTAVRELSANLEKLQADYNELEQKSALKAKQLREEAKGMLTAVEKQLAEKTEELEDANAELMKANIATRVSQKSADEEKLQKEKALDAQSKLNVQLAKLKEELTRANVTGDYANEDAQAKYNRLAASFESYKAKAAADLDDLRAKQAALEEKLTKAAEEERATLEAALERAKREQETELQRKERALAEMEARLEALRESLENVKEAEASTKLALERAEAKAAEEAKAAAEAAARVAEAQAKAAQEEKATETEKPPATVSVETQALVQSLTQAAVAGTTPPLTSPEYLRWLFGPEGVLSAPMDFGQFVYTTHQYMLYMRDVFGIDCMVSVLGYDPVEIAASDDEPLEDEASSYDDFVFRVVSTTPQMSKAAQTHFQDPGTLLPQDSATCHYRVCNSGQAETWDDEELRVSLRCDVLTVAPERMRTAKGMVPAFGTILFIIPQRAHLGEDRATVKANLLRHEPTFEEAMYQTKFSGKLGLSRAADLLGEYELGVVGRLRNSRVSQVSAASGPKPTPAELQVAYGNLQQSKRDLEDALLKTTLNSALMELKRYRRPADTVIALLLGTLLLVQDEHVQPFMENLDFALGPKGANQLSYIWVVARAKLVVGMKEGSIVKLMRAAGKDAKNPRKGVETLRRLSPEARALDKLVHHWAGQILDHIDEKTAEKASRVLHVLREWMVVVTDMRRILGQLSEDS